MSLRQRTRANRSSAFEGSLDEAPALRRAEFDKGRPSERRAAGATWRMPVPIRSTARMPAKPGEPRSAGEAHQHRLGLVVQRMGGDEMGCAGVPWPVPTRRR